MAAPARRLGEPQRPPQRSTIRERAIVLQKASPVLDFAPVPLEQVKAERREEVRVMSASPTPTPPPVAFPIIARVQHKTAVDPRELGKVPRAWLFVVAVLALLGGVGIGVGVLMRGLVVPTASLAAATSPPAQLETATATATISAAPPPSAVPSAPSVAKTSTAAPRLPPPPSRAELGLPPIVAAKPAVNAKAPSGATKKAPAKVPVKPHK